MEKCSSSELRVCAAISGHGTVLRAVLRASEAGLLPLKFYGFVADRFCPGLDMARKSGIPAECVEFSSFATRDSFDRVFEEQLLAAHPDLILLHYNRLVTSRLIQALPGRILNTHYSLLPSFRGFRAIPRAISTGVLFTGVTIHIVTEEMDAGPVLAQAVSPIQPDDTSDSLGLRLCAVAVYLTLALLAEAPNFGRQRPIGLSLPGGEEVMLSHPVPERLRDFADAFVSRELVGLSHG